MILLELFFETRMHDQFKAYAGLTKAGTVVTWGNGRYGGNCDKVKHELTNIQTVYSSGWAFCAFSCTKVFISFSWKFEG